MSVATAIRGMLAAGLTIEQALIAVEAMEHVKGARSSGAERQARYRDRQKASLVTSHNVTDVTTVTPEAEILPPPVSPLFPSPQPLTKNPPLSPTNTPLVADDASATSSSPSKSKSAETPKARGSPDRATRLPPDWSAPTEFIDFAIAEGFTHDDIVRRIEPTFRDYWVAASGSASRKADWLATWRNWVRREAERRPGARQADAGRNGQPARSVLGAYQRASARIQAQGVLPPKRPGTLDL